jgi:helicase MOV-10
LLQRLIQHEAYDYREHQGTTITKLLQNYRNHPAILKFPSERFYDGELKACADPIITESIVQKWDELPNKRFPILFHGVVAKDEREAKSPSWFNPIEAGIVKQYVDNLLGNTKLGLKPEMIGVITPYHAQVQKIRKALKNRVEKGLQVGSTEIFQGQVSFSSFEMG